MNNKITYLFAFFLFVFASNIFAGDISTYKEAKAVEANLYRNYPNSGDGVDFCEECSYKATRLTIYTDKQNRILYIVRECGTCGLYILQKATPDIIDSVSKPYDLLKKATILFKGRNPLFTGGQYY